MKLKTIDEIFTQERFEEVNTGIIERDLIDELKAEAVKEIKILMTNMKTPQDLLWEETTGYTMEYVNKEVIINYIKWKFNITEDDLK